MSDTTDPTELPPPPAERPVEHVEAELLPRNAAAGRARHRPPGGKRVSPVEVARRLEAVEALLLVGVSARERIRMAKEKLGMSQRTLEDYEARVRKAWLVEDEANRPHRRAAARRRLERDLQKMRGREGSKPWREIHMHEDLLAKVDGLLVGPRVAVQVNNSTTNNIAGVPAGWQSLTEEQLVYVAANDGRLPPGITDEYLLSPGPNKAASPPPAPSPPEPAGAR